MPYYTNVNPDLLDRIPMTALRILEIGCGDGSLGLAVKARNPKAEYFGAELFEDVANIARQRLDGVVCGNIEENDTFELLEKMAGDTSFDALVFGDALEHLLNPWDTLKALRGLMGEDAVCIACIPNIGHWSVIKQQMGGRWDYADSGLPGRRHLRFFTRETACELFKNAGWNVTDCFPRVIWTEQTNAALAAFEPLIANLKLDAAKAKQDLSAFQWVVRGVNGKVQPKIDIAALALKKLAGVNEARVDYPLKALSSTVTAQAVWGEGTLAIPKYFKPGILILHRQFLNADVLARHVERFIEAGWVVISEIDDDPAHWTGYTASDYIAFRGVHAVTVSTQPLAQLLRTYNPHVKVFENAVFELPSPKPKEASPSGKKRIFFGALNRRDDWLAIQESLLPALQELREQVQIVVVHDKDIFDSLPSDLDKVFFATLPPADYLKLLATCDIALLPLRDTPFNRLKSDIKLIECCAAGAVPIFSNVVYENTEASGNLGLMLAQGANWGDAVRSLVSDPARLTGYREAGFDYVTSQRMHCQSITERQNWLRSLIDNRETLEKDRRARLALMGRTNLIG